jgi:AcrR family transcriptional regulator
VGKGAVTRAAILDAAVAVSCRRGLAGLNLDPLARDAGLSKSGLFAHFGSRAALERATLERAAQRFRETVLAPAKREPAGLGQLTGVFNRWLDWPGCAGLPGSCPFFAAAFELDDEAGPARDQLIGLVREFLGVLAALTDQAIRRGQLSTAADPRALALGLLTLRLAYHWQARLLRDADARERALQSLERLLVESGAGQVPGIGPVIGR